MHVEPATPEDCRAIAGVHVHAWQHAYKDMLPAEYLASLSVDKREAMWRVALAKGMPQLLVARVEAEVAGFIAFGPSRDKGAQPQCSEIWSLYLAPPFWSRGVGRMLWLAALDRIHAQDFKTVSLWVLAGNTRATRFYAAAGFKPEPASAQEFSLGGATLQEVRYLYSG